VWLFCATNKQVQSPQLDFGRAVTLFKLMNISTLDLRTWVHQHWSWYLSLWRFLRETLFKKRIWFMYKECPDEKKNIRSLQYLEAEVLD